MTEAREQGPAATEPGWARGVVVDRLSPADMDEMRAVVTRHRDGGRCEQCRHAESIWTCPAWLRWWPWISGGSVSG